MRSRILFALILTVFLTLLAATSANARLTTKLVVGKDASLNALDLPLGGLGLGSGQLIAPNDADIGPGGEVYVLLPQDCSVRVFDSAGAQVRQFGSCPSDNNNASGAQLLSSARSIAVDARGRAYISSYGYLTITDKDGSVLQRFDSDSPGLQTTGQAVAVTDSSPSDPDGATSLFVANRSQQRVDKYSVAYDDNAVSFDWAAGVNVDSADPGTGYEVCVVQADCVAGGASDDGFNSPIDIDASSAAGPLVVLNKSGQEVVRVDPTTGTKQGTSTTFAGGQYASAIAARTGGGFWMSPSGMDPGTVIGYDGSGSQDDQIGTLNSPSAAAGGIGGAYGLGSDASGNLIVADTSMNRASLFDADGNHLMLFGKNDGIGWQRGSGVGEFQNVTDVTPDGAGGFWALDYFGDRVLRFSSAGAQLQSIDLSTGLGQPGFYQYGPLGIGASPDGSALYLADSFNNRVIRFNIGVVAKTSAFAWMIGKDVVASNGVDGSEVCLVAASCKGGVSGTDNQSFNSPVDVTVSPTTGDIWVADQNNNRIQRFDANGNWGNTVPSAMDSAHNGDDGHFFGPQSIAFQTDGSFWVTSYDARVQKFSAAGTYVQKFRPGNGIYGVQTLDGIAVSGSELFVAQSSLGRIAVYPTSTSQDSGPAPPARTIGAIGSNAGQFWQPRGIAFLASGDLAVADQGNSRVQVIGEDAGAASPGPITFISPDPASKVFNGTKVKIEFDAHDLDGGAMTCTPASGSLVDLPHVGSNQLNVSCDDPLSETDVTGTININRVDDLNAPTVVIDTPVTGSTVTTASVTLDYGATDDQDVDPPNCDRTSGDSVALSPGLNTITVSCTDWAGNVGSASVSVTYTPPIPPVTPAPPGAGGGSTTSPTASVKFPKKIKFKGSVSVTVTCDMACPLSLTLTAKVGKKKYTAKARATLTAAGSRVLKVKFSKKSTKAILAQKKLPKLGWALSYGAKTGKSGSVKISR